MDKDETTDDDADDVADSFKDDLPLVVCSQCRIVADFENLRLTKKRWLWNKEAPFEKIGIRCSCHGHKFCNAQCLERHLKGEMPAVISPDLQKAMDEKEKADLGAILLVQAIERSRREEKEEGKSIERQLERRRRKSGNYAAPDYDDEDNRGSRPVAWSILFT